MKVQQSVRDDDECNLGENKFCRLTKIKLIVLALDLSEANVCLYQLIFCRSDSVTIIGIFFKLKPCLIVTLSSLLLDFVCPINFQAHIQNLLSLKK